MIQAIHKARVSVFILLALALCAGARAELLRVSSATGEVLAEWNLQEGVRRIELDALARDLGMETTWDPLLLRQQYRYGDAEPVVFLAQSRQARLGDRLVLMPAVPRRDRNQFWIPYEFVVDVLFPYWGLSSAEAAARPEDLPPPPERFDRISDLIERARAEQAAATASLRINNIVLLDPGHGGEDTGSVALSGVEEADVMLALSEQLARTLRQRAPQLRIENTRPGGEGLSVEERCGIANRSEADLLISLHAGSRRGGSDRGTWIYYMLDLVDSDTVLAAAPAGDGLPVWELGYLDFQGRSRRLAEALAEALTEPGRPEPVVAPARLRLLRGCALPSVLIEIGDLNNESDLARLNTPVGRQALCNRLAAGVLAYLREGATP